VDDKNSPGSDKNNSQLLGLTSSTGLGPSLSTIQNAQNAGVVVLFLLGLPSPHQTTEHLKPTTSSTTTTTTRCFLCSRKSFFVIVQCDLTQKKKHLKTLTAPRLPCPSISVRPLLYPYLTQPQPRFLPIFSTKKKKFLPIFHHGPARRSTTPRGPEAQDRCHDKWWRFTWNEWSYPSGGTDDN
jgi:hypothetical protein